MPTSWGQLLAARTWTSARSSTWAAFIAKDAALGGSGTLSTAVTQNLAVAVALSGAGALTIAAAPRTARTVALSGSGSLSIPTRRAGPTQAVSLSGAGSLTAAVPSPVIEPWTGADGATWPAQWTTGGDVTPVISGNQGKLQAATSQSYRAANGWANGATSLADFDRTFQVTFSDLGELTFVYAERVTSGTRDPGNSAFPITGVSVLVGASSIELYRNSSGGFTQTATTAFSPSANTQYTVRFKGTGTSLQAKVWLSSGSEPGAWAVSSTDAANPTNTGTPWFGIRGGGDSVGRYVLLDNLSNYQAAAAPSASVPLSGTGTLSVSRQIAASTLVALGGTGSLSASAALATSGTVSLGGSGTLSASGAPNQTGIVGLGGSATLSGSGSAPITSSVALSGAGTLGVTGTPAGSRAVALSGSGSLAASGTAPVTGTASLSGSATLTSANTGVTTALVTLGGSGTLSTAQNPALTVSVALSGAGTLSATGVVSRTGVASLSGTGALAASGEIRTVTFFLGGLPLTKLYIGYLPVTRIFLGTQLVMG